MKSQRMVSEVVDCERKAQVGPEGFRLVRLVLVSSLCYEMFGTFILEVYRQRTPVNHQSRDARWLSFDHSQQEVA